MDSLDGSPCSDSSTERSGWEGVVETARHFLTDIKRKSNIESEYSELYEDALRYVDSQIQRIVGQLEAMGVWDDTVLIVTSDHGEAVYEDGFVGHPVHYLSPELLHVPLLIRIPGYESMRNEAPFSLGWLHELIAEVTGADPLDAPLRSHSDSDSNGWDAQSVPTADSLSREAHTKVAITGDEYLVEHTVFSDEETELEYVTDDAYSSVSSGENLRLAEAIDSLAATPDQLVPLSESISDETSDRLKQLGYL